MNMLQLDYTIFQILVNIILFSCKVPPLKGVKISSSYNFGPCSFNVF